MVRELNVPHPDCESRIEGAASLPTFRHLGAAGLFFLAILDSTPLPTFGGPDILMAILAASHRNPWYEYAAVATAGSLIGAYITFRLARKAGAAYLNSKFGQGRVSMFLKLFRRSGTGALVASTAIPLPFPTSMVFAAAGASDYRWANIFRSSPCAAPRDIRPSRSSPIFTGGTSSA